MVAVVRLLFRYVYDVPWQDALLLPVTPPIPLPEAVLFLTRKQGVYLVSYSHQLQLII